MTDAITRLDTPILSLKIKADLNWDGIGAHFANVNSDQQRDFLLAMTSEFDRIGYLATDHQFNYIASDPFLDKRDREQIASHLRRLANFLDEEMK